MLLRRIDVRLAVHALPRGRPSSLSGSGPHGGVGPAALTPSGTRYRTSLSATRPRRPGPFGPKQFQLAAGQMRRRAADAVITRCHGRGIGAHDPADDPRTGKPCDGCDVAVGRHLARRNCRTSARTARLARRYRSHGQFAFSSLRPERRRQRAWSRKPCAGQANRAVQSGPQALLKWMISRSGDIGPTRSASHAPASFAVPAGGSTVSRANSLQ